MRFYIKNYFFSKTFPWKKIIFSLFLMQKSVVNTNLPMEDQKNRILLGNRQSEGVNWKFCQGQFGCLKYLFNNRCSIEKKLYSFEKMWSKRGVILLHEKSMYTPPLDFFWYTSVCDVPAKSFTKISMRVWFQFIFSILHHEILIYCLKQN
jgi:hypothetical protein